MLVGACVRGGALVGVGVESVAGVRCVGVGIGTGVGVGAGVYVGVLVGVTALIGATVGVACCPGEGVGSLVGAVG